MSPPFAVDTLYRIGSEEGPVEAVYLLAVAFTTGTILLLASAALATMHLSWRLGSHYWKNFRAGSAAYGPR